MGETNNINKIRICVNCSEVFIPRDKGLACTKCGDASGTFSFAIVLADFISRHKGFTAKLSCPPCGQQLVKDERQNSLFTAS